jgi:hypothetical protein
LLPMMVAKMLLGKMIGIGIGIRGVMLLPFSILRPIERLWIVGNCRGSHLYFSY